MKEEEAVVVTMEVMEEMMDMVEGVMVEVIRITIQMEKIILVVVVVVRGYQVQHQELEALE